MDITFELISELRQEGLSWREIGKKLAEGTDIDPYLLQERARKKYRRYVNKRKNADGGETSSVSVPAHPFDNEDIDLEDTESLLKLHGYNPDEWVVIDSSCNRRSQGTTTRIKVAPRSIPPLDEEILSDKLSDAVERVSRPIAKRVPKKYHEEVAVIPLYDVHYGKRGSDGDHRETERRVLTAMEDIVEKLEKNVPKDIILPIGQDFCNVDNAQNTTTKGTAQMTSLEWHEIVSGALALAVRVIDMLSEIAPVRVFYSKGNHDEVTSFGIVKALEERYRHDTNINVSSDIHPRQYQVWHNVLMGFSHGNEEKNLSSLMQVEKKEAWGECDHHYWFTGHLHHVKMHEKDGVTIIQCPSLSMDDRWHTNKGFVTARKSLMMAVFTIRGLKEIYFATP